MTDDVDKPVLEHLRAIREILGDHTDRLNRIELRLSTIEQTLEVYTRWPVVTGKPWPR